MRHAFRRFVVCSGAVLLGLAYSASQAPAEPIAADDAKKTEAADAAKAPENKDIEQAIELFKKRDFDGTLKMLKEAAAKDPDLVPPQIIMAQLFSQANISAAVRQALEKAVVESPDDPEAYLWLADVALRDRRITEADLLFRKAADLAAKFDKSAKRKEGFPARLHNGLASVAESRDDWAGAQKEFEAWLAVDAKNANAVQRLAHSLFRQKNIDGAMEKLRDAAKLDPNQLTPEAILAQFCIQSGQRDEAKKWMAEALKASPKDARTHLFAAQFALDNQDFDAAKAEADATLKIDPKSLEAKVYLGLVALFQKDYKTAEMYFESAHLQAPGNFAASNYLALSLVEQKDEAKKRKALEYAEANARQFPKMADAISTYGWVLYKLGRLDEAEQVLRAAASSPNFKAETIYYLARLAVDRGRSAEAKQLLEAALGSGAAFPQRQEAQSLLEQVSK